MVLCDKYQEPLPNSEYKILIVEDSEFVNNAIFKTLSDMGYQCEQAFDYEVALFKLQYNEYDYVILDLNLPDAYGNELVRNVQNTTKAKIIILTAETDIQSREILFKNGILDYLVKDKYFNNSILSIDQIIHSIERNVISTILVIDDSRVLRKHIELILKVRDYNVVEAENAEEALLTLNTQAINLIILDMELPDKHGLDVIRELKADPMLRTIPIFVVSGSNNPETVRDCLKLGATNYIKKPFNVEEFILKIDIEINTERNARDILCNQKLLNEYKDAVDRSNIVSKADLKGNITYVNDKFCEISGYKEEELIGQPHNIVHHEDMSSETFADMWKTIKDKKPWHGVVKNKTKNGKDYYVDTVINPIIDYDGNLVEYISLRTDVTEIELMKKNL